MSSGHVTYIVYLPVSTELQIIAFCQFFSLPQAQFLPLVSSPLLETITKSNLKYLLWLVQNRSCKPKFSCLHFIFSCSNITAFQKKAGMVGDLQQPISHPSNRRWGSLHWALSDLEPYWYPNHFHFCFVLVINALEIFSLWQRKITLSAVISN